MDARGGAPHLRAVAATPTLAEKLGTTAHLSPLLRKAARLGLGAAELRALAVQRGCRHYQTGNEPATPPPPPGVLPHPTRYVAMTGFTRQGPGLVVRWIRPEQTAA